MRWALKRHPPVVPVGTYTLWSWPPARSGFQEMHWDLEPRTDPSPVGYFWSHQVGLVGGEAAYLGLQTEGSEPTGKIAIFSVWGATVAIVRAQAEEFDQLPAGTPTKVISLYSPAPEPLPSAAPATPVTHRAAEAPASARTRTLPVSYLPPEEPKGAAPPEFSVPGAPLAPAPVAAPAAPAAAAPDRWLLMKALQGSWAGNAMVGSRLNIYGWTEGSYTAGSEGHGAWPMLAQ